MATRIVAWETSTRLRNRGQPDHPPEGVLDDC
jgi:hypothetical protein